MDLEENAHPSSDLPPDAIEESVAIQPSVVIPTEILSNNGPTTTNQVSSHQMTTVGDDAAIKTEEMKMDSYSSTNLIASVDEGSSISSTLASDETTHEMKEENGEKALGEEEEESSSSSSDDDDEVVVAMTGMDSDDDLAGEIEDMKKNVKGPKTKNEVVTRTSFLLFYSLHLHHLSPLTHPPLFRKYLFPNQ
jgi:hypothetical protein